MDTSYYKKYEPIFGKWHIVRELGEGSFGKVFEIERRDFGGTYKAALKAITIPQSQSEVKDILASGMDEQSVTSYFRGFVEEMIAEFVLMSKLKGHSNIVSYEDHDVIQHAEGIGWDIFIRMELLTPLLDYTRKSDLSRSDVIKLGIDICKALEVCRKNNIIHRDIKPQNIFISDLGDFKLGDFGIARTVEKTMGGLSKKGTYHYMAPEVFKSEPYGASVDIYSLGIVLYRFMNNNRLPFFPPFPSPIKFSDSDAALARRMKGETIPAPANADEALSQVILKACAYSPKDRYLTPTDMRRDLEALLGDVEQQPDLDKTVGVFSGKGTAKVDAPVTAPTDVKEPEPASETAEPVSKTAAFFAEPLPTVSDAGTVGIFNSNRASNTEQQVADSFDKAENPPKRQVHRSFAPTSESDRNALMEAVKNGDVSAVSELLAKGVDPNCERVLADGSRYSPLFDSILEWPNDAIASILINAGADVNYIGNAKGVKLPVLSAAICAGNVGIVERLLSKGADPNCERVLADGSRYSPLFDSILVWPNDAIASILINAGADVNYVGFDGSAETPLLFYAICMRSVKLVEYLLRNGADPNYERVLADGSRYSALFDSICNFPNDEITKLLIDAGADVNYVGFADGVKYSVLHATISHAAISKSTVDILRPLLWKSNVAILKLLLSKGADPNCERVLADGSRYSPLLDSIVEWPNDAIASILINAGADVNYIGNFNGAKVPVLSYAICKSNVDSLKLLLSNGANPCCEIVFIDGSRSSVLRDCILRCPNAQIIDLLCSYMNPLPDDVRGLKVKRSGLSEQTIKKLKAAGCMVKMF